MAKIDGRTLNHNALEHMRILAVKLIFYVRREKAHESSGRL